MCVWCSRGKRGCVSLTHQRVSRYLEAHGHCGHRTAGGYCWGSFLESFLKETSSAFDLLLATWVMTLHVEKCCVDGQQGQVRRSLPGGEDTSEPLPQAWLPLLEGTSLFFSGQEEAPCPSNLHLQCENPIQPFSTGTPQEN